MKKVRIISIVLRAVCIWIFISSNLYADSFRKAEYRDAVLSFSPLLYCELDEIEGIEAVDSSGNGLTGIFGGQPNLLASGLLDSSEGSAAAFAGIEDYIEFADDGRLDLRRQLSFTFWLKMESINGGTVAPLVYKALSNDSATRTYGLFLYSDGRLHFFSTDTSGQQNIDSPAGTIVPGKWYHIAGVIDRNAGTMNLYVNGTKKTSGSVRISDTVSHAAPLYLSGYPVFTGWGRLNGTFDEFSLYDYALTEEQVFDLHDAITGPMVVAVTSERLINITEQDFDSISILFSDPLDFTGDETGSFWLDDIQIVGPQGAVDPNQIIDIIQIDDSEYQVQFLPQVIPGRYSFSIGPNLTDINGYAMDQDQDGTLGEPSVDVFVFTVLAHRGEILFYEGFEYADTNWLIDNGVWQIGIPSSGGTRSGDNVAATNLTGYYPLQTDSRLISPSVALPSVVGDEQLELRFWHWFDYDGGDGNDKGYVQISVWDGSGWSSWSTLATPVDAHEGDSYERTYNSSWSRCAMDLTAYEDQRIRLAFYHVASSQDSYDGSRSGWYIDDVELWQGIPQMPALEDFEAGWGDWSANHGVWQIGEPTSGPGAAYDGISVAATHLGGNYPSQTDSQLISPVVNLPAVAGDE
ncbi:MAG: LamG domain-containing protein, partial [Sedimentisphaerales bacterium]|nr:LamG domain-containing protein [Sedimentisphaerales bacterium]